MADAGGWALWLVARRREIDAALAHARPVDPGAPETEALRRFRSFASATLRQGEITRPALDGLRVSAERAHELVTAWCEAACRCAGEQADALRALLEPLARRYHEALLTAGAARAAERARPARRRRAVVAAIDRIADAYLALDLDDAAIVDANPAAARLLETPREALVGRALARVVPPEAEAPWREALEALVEADEPRRFLAELRARGGARIPVEAVATRCVSRGRTLALVLARPHERAEPSSRYTRPPCLPPTEPNSKPPSPARALPEPS